MSLAWNPALKAGLRLGVRVFMSSSSFRCPCPRCCSFEFNSVPPLHNTTNTTSSRSGRLRVPLTSARPYCIFVTLSSPRADSNGGSCSAEPEYLPYLVVILILVRFASSRRRVHGFAFSALTSCVARVRLGERDSSSTETRGGPIRMRCAARADMRWLCESFPNRRESHVTWCDRA
jgi:hypothetical protein